MNVYQCLQICTYTAHECMLNTPLSGWLVRFWRQGWWLMSPLLANGVTLVSDQWLSFIFPLISYSVMDNHVDKLQSEPYIPPNVYVVRLRCGTAVELICFNSSQHVGFQWLWLRCISTPSQLWWSGALRSRYTRLLFLPDDEAQRSNSATEHIGRDEKSDTDATFKNLKCFSLCLASFIKQVITLLLI